LFKGLVRLSAPQKNVPGVMNGDKGRRKCFSSESKKAFFFLNVGWLEKIGKNIYVNIFI